MRGITTVEQLISALQKLDKASNILIGDHDKGGRNDRLLGKIVRKTCGFDGKDDSYYVLTSLPTTGCCLKRVDMEPYIY